MARNETWIGVPLDGVFAVLADPRCYGIWVVGSSTIRAADPGWPAPGTAFDHTVGAGPLHIADCTEMLESDPPYRVLLRAHARPLPPAIVSLELVGERNGTRVIMREDLDQRPLRLALWPLTQPAVKLRNAESLRRLKALAEGEIDWPTGELPPRGVHAASAQA